MQHENALLALELTDRLLNAWAAAMAAAAPGQQRRQLHQAYSSVKSRLLEALLEQAQVLGLGQPGEMGESRFVTCYGSSCLCAPAKDDATPGCDNFKGVAEEPVACCRCLMCLVASARPGPPLLRL